MDKIVHNERLEQGAMAEEFLKTCKAEGIVGNKIIECLVKIPPCNCFLHYGNSIFCQHSLKHDIAKRTQEENGTRK